MSVENTDKGTSIKADSVSEPILAKENSDAFWDLYGI
jgi:hypothetical protein